MLHNMHREVCEQKRGFIKGHEVANSFLKKKKIRKIKISKRSNQVNRSK
jgi:hypothetical protein